jgi:formylglycine-generating enzyme required for sulfatase activity
MLRRIFMNYRRPLLWKPAATASTAALLLAGWIAPYHIGMAVSVVQPDQGAETAGKLMAHRRRTAKRKAPEGDPALSVTPGSGQSFHDRQVNGQLCRACPEMVVAPSGSFTMGSPDNEPERNIGELQVRVEIARPFAVGKFAVTRAQFDAFLKATAYQPDKACSTLLGNES